MKVNAGSLHSLFTLFVILKMEKQEVINVLKQIKPLLEKEFGIKSIALF